tara:strand:+ start:428 stop:829 length:402 start_codon:yes stop_codon:yes gene_type:complete
VDAQVDVVELLPKVVEWNRNLLKDLNGALLDDPRVKVIEADAVERNKQDDAQSYDVVILDVENGPTGMVKATNNSLYSHKGLRTVRKLLKPSGCAIFWSACEDPTLRHGWKQSDSGWGISGQKSMRAPSAPTK